MKGIKECIQWLFNNDNKWLVSNAGYMIRYTEGKFQTSTTNSDLIGNVNDISLPAFETYEWQEYRKPYTMDKAREVVINSKCLNAEEVNFKRGNVIMSYCNEMNDVKLKWSDSVIKNIEISLGGSWFRVTK